MQRAAGQHATAPGHAASLIAAAQQPIAAVPKQQTGNEHLDGKLKIIGIVPLILTPSMCALTKWQGLVLAFFLLAVLASAGISARIPRYQEYLQQ